MTAPYTLSTPVVLLLFNRPEETRRTFAEIAKAKPAKLFIVADGPRPGHASDYANCAAARAVVEEIDWDCEVRHNFAVTNLGLKARVSSGLSWVFDQVEEAIILEDDCLPHPTFFRFCAELLAHYRDDDRVALISGDNFLNVAQRPHYSYYFSIFMHIWGWATWRRAWRHYDEGLSTWPDLRETKWLAQLFSDETAGRYWRWIFDRVKSGEINSWDYPWAYSCWTQHMLAVLPTVNLVSNIGFNSAATHTRQTNHQSANRVTMAQEFPLRHPPVMVRDYTADKMTLSMLGISGVSPYRRLMRLVNSRLPANLRPDLSRFRR